MSDYTELLDALEAISSYHARMLQAPDAFGPRRSARTSVVSFHQMAREEIDLAIYTLIKQRARIDDDDYGER